MTINFRTASATARHAGRNVVHTVYGYDGEVVATRRSAHRYEFAICRRIGFTDDGTARVVVDRWSRSSKCSSRQFAIRAVWQEQ